MNERGHAVSRLLAVRTFLAGRSGQALLAVTSGSFLITGVQMIYPVMIPQLREAYGIGLTMAGLLVTVMWLTNAIGQIPGGLLADRVGERKTLSLSVALSAVTLLVIMLVKSVVALFVATAALGVGVALYGVARYTAVYELLPEREGIGVGVVLAGADAGQAVLPPIATITAVTLTWQFGFGVTLPLFVLVGLGIWLFLPRTEPNNGDDESLSVGAIRTVLAEMRSRTIALSTAALVVYMAVWISFTTFYPTYVIDTKGLSPTLASGFFGLFFAIGVVIKPIAGGLYDRAGMRTALLFTSGLSILGLTALPFVHDPVAIGIVTLLIAPLLGTGAIAQTHLLSAFTRDRKGTGLGVIRTGSMGVAAVTPTIFGGFAERGFFDEMFMLLAVLAGVLTVVAFRFR